MSKHKPIKPSKRACKVLVERKKMTMSSLKHQLETMWQSHQKLNEQLSPEFELHEDMVKVDFQYTPMTDQVALYSYYYKK